VAQFVGHGVFEGRQPALLDNLFQAFFMAPIFVLLEVSELKGWGRIECQGEGREFSQLVD
jgi:2-hydroxy fatty acid dioxygenase